MIIISVPKCGTRFTRELLGCPFDHVTNGGIEERIEKAGGGIVVPLRDPASCYVSWYQQAWPLKDFFPSWRKMLELVGKYSPDFLCVDRLIRYDQLAHINKKYGLDAKTNWIWRRDDLRHVPKDRLVIPDLEEIYDMPFVSEFY